MARRFVLFAPDLPMLVGFRVLQAIGAAMLQANSVAIITAAAPRAKLGRAIGVQGAAQALGLALGPAAGAATMGSISRSNGGVGSGLLNMARGLGTAVGLAVTGLVFTAFTGSHPEHAHQSPRSFRASVTPCWCSRP